MIFLLGKISLHRSIIDHFNQQQIFIYLLTSQRTFTCSKLKIETLDKGEKYVQN